MPACHLVALRREVRIVEFLDFLRDPEDCFAAWKDFAAKEGRAVVDLLADRPIEERFEPFPVIVEVGLEAANAAFVLASRPCDREQFGDGCAIGLAEGG